MHISEGVLSAPVLAVGAVATVAGTAIGLKKIDYQGLPQVALLAAVFFVASLIHVPLGPSSAHLVLVGLLGVILGWATFPAILVGLTLQALLFQYGGLICLGANTLNMALPGVMVYFLCAPLVRSQSKVLATLAGFAAGAGGLFLATTFTALSLYLSGESFLTAGQALFLAHLPLMAVEGVITALAVGFVRQVRPALLAQGWQG